jgi:hypothetical protein
MESWNVFNHMNETRGEINKRLLSEPYQEQFCGVKFPRNHRLYPNFNHKITQLYEAGIIEKYIKDHTENVLNPKWYEKPKLPHKKYLETTWRKSFIDEPKVLTMKDLEFGFVIWLGALVLPVIGFILEWLIKLKNGLVMKFVFAAYYDRKHSQSSDNVEKRIMMLRDLKTFSLLTLDDMFAPEIKTDIVNSEQRTSQTLDSIVDLEDAFSIENCFGEKTKMDNESEPQTLLGLFNNFLANSKYHEYAQKKNDLLNYPEKSADDDSMIHLEDKAIPETDVDDPDEESHTIV